MTSKSELKRHVALGKPGALAEELWEKYSDAMPGQGGLIGYEDFLAALAEYGQYIGAAVRARDAEVCAGIRGCGNWYMENDGKVTGWNDHKTNLLCAAAIREAPLP